MANIDLCVNCGILRTIVNREWLLKGYEIQSLQCPLCENVVRLAQKCGVRNSREYCHQNRLPSKRSNDMTFLGRPAFNINNARCFHANVRPGSRGDTAKSLLCPWRRSRPSGSISILSSVHCANVGAAA